MPKSITKSKKVAGLGQKFLLHAPEIFIFSACHGIVQALRTLDRAFEAGQTDEAAFVDRVNALLVELSCAAEATHRFDLVMPVTGCGQFSFSFWKWFNWWNDYRNTLTSAQLDRIERIGRARKIAVIGQRPEGDWLTYRQTPAFELEIT